MESAPRSLEQLLNSLKMDVKDLEDLETFISNQTWIKKFYQFLENRQLDDHMQTLKFLISLKLLEKQAAAPLIRMMCLLAEPKAPPL